MSRRPRIVFIGAGNVATHLAQAFYRAGYPIAAVCSRTRASAGTLAEKVKAPFTNRLHELPAADVYIIAVNDDAIARVARHPFPAQALVLHTSGGTGLDVLKQHSKRGVLYPLQTFSRAHSVDMKQVPFCIEAGSPQALSLLRRLALSVSGNIHRVSSQQRQVLHLAAVFACNFSNHLYAIADELLSASKLPFRLLEPLIAETARKAIEEGPARSQTGPAIRKDHQVMKKHLQLLSNKKELQRLYRLMSRSIMEQRA
ncbi:MAG: Rossmann-like and DUF2520 domain-containing protein [Bacteroidota bacterium]